MKNNEDRLLPPIPSDNPSNRDIAAVFGVGISWDSIISVQSFSKKFAVGSETVQRRSNGTTSHVAHACLFRGVVL